MYSRFCGSMFEQLKAITKQYNESGAQPDSRFDSDENDEQGRAKRDGNRSAHICVTVTLRDA